VGLTWRQNRRLCSRLAVGLVSIVFAEELLVAQAALHIRPSVATSEVYDSNLFSSPTNVQADFITRVTPAVEAEYTAPRWTLTGRYGLDLERFATHQELSSAIAGLRALTGFDRRLSPRSVLTAAAEFSQSQNAADLSQGIGLTFVRATAQRIAARSSLTRQLTPASAGKVGYSFASDHLAGTPDIRTQTASLGVDRHVSPRATVRVAYRLREYAFGQGSSISHVVSAGWEHAVRPGTSLSIDLGPSVTSGSTTVEGAVSLRNRFKSADVAVTYARTQTTVFGIDGLVSTQSITATTAWRVRRSLLVSWGPAFYRSEQGSLQADAYRFAAGVVQTLTRSLAVGLTYDGGVQNGTLYPTGGPQTIGRQQFLVRFIAGPTAGGE
jgi:hypothetical protein